MSEPIYPGDQFQHPSHPAQVPPAGWYPIAAGWQGYWDGEMWTGHQAPLPAQPGSAASNDNNLALFTHLGGALLGILVPIVIFVVKKDESPFVRHHALEALNFHITLWLASFVSIALILVVIGIFLLIGLIIAFYVLSVVAAVAASKGEWYRYPMTIRIFT
jgi:uncharacterized Tic20 family protein